MTATPERQAKVEELRRELADCEAQYGPRDVRTASAAMQLAGYRQHDDANGFAEAESLALRAVDIFESLGEDYQRSLAWPFRLLASIRHRQGKQAEADSLLRRVIELDQEDGEDGPLSYDDLHELGCSLLDQRRYVEAAEFLERALQVVEREFGADYQCLGHNLNPLAQAYLGLKRYDDAIDLFRRELDLQLRHRADDLHSRAGLLEQIAEAQSQAGRHELGDECFREAQELRAQEDAQLIAQVPDQQNPDAHYQEMDNLLEQADARALRRDFAGAIALVEKVLDHRGRRSPAGPAALPGLLRKLARWRMELEEFTAAETLLQQARGYLESQALALEELQQKMREQRSAPEWRPGLRNRPIETYYSESLAGIYNELGVLFLRQRQWDDAVDGFQRAVTIWKVTHEKSPGYVSAGLSNIALALREQGDLARACEVLAEALAWEQQIQDESIFVANLLSNLAVYRQEQEQLEEAAELLLGAVKLWIKNEGACHPHVLHGLNQAGQVLTDLRQWDRARDCLLQALGLVREASWGNSQPIAALLLSLSSIELRQKRFAQALPYLHKALPLCEAEPERLAEEYQSVLRRLTESLVMLDQFDEAEVFGLRWLALLQRTVPSNDPELPPALANLAITYQGHRRPAQALPLIEQAIPLVEQIASATDPAAVATYYHIKADILRSLHRFAAAKAAEVHARKLKP